MQISALGLPVVLMIYAHNGKTFDFTRFFSFLERNNLLLEFNSLVDGLIDTLPSISKRRPRQPNNLKALSEALQINYSGAHDALAVVHILIKILKELQITND